MKFLFWRGDSLYCRYPLPDHPKRYPLEIYSTGTPEDRKRCEAQGELVLAKFRVQDIEGRFFDKKVEQEAPKIYDPTFRRIWRRYICNHLRWKKSGPNDIYHAKPSYFRFGTKPARSITRDDTECWRQEQIRDGVAINTINNRIAYLGAVYAWANSESDVKKRLCYSPLVGLEKLTGGNVRTFVLTKKKFERNYAFLRDGLYAREGTRKKHATPWAATPCPQFALFYLALWETGRRPQEVAQYTWEQVQELDIDGRKVHAIFVPPKMTKADEPDIIPISDRLWHEMFQLAYRTGFIFRNSTGGRWFYWDIHKRKLEKAFGSDGGWIRDCRRGFVTHKCEEEGHDPAYVKAIAGHRTDSMFKRYRIGSLRNLVKVVNPRPNQSQVEKTA